MQHLDVIIVGAGPAGIGMAMELARVPDLHYAILEGQRIGESFRRWPAQTRLITPSFYSSPFGLADLNAVDHVSSPAIHAGTEHLSGPQYADYLEFVVNAAGLMIATDCKVLQVTPDPEFGFHIVSDHGELYTQVLIWACGEYQFPDLSPFPGAQWCTHYAQIDDWQSLDVGQYTVIGGYESGLDAAINLIRLGCEVRLLVRSKTWDLDDIYDPSQVLSPYTRQRLREVENSDLLDIVFDGNVNAVMRTADGFSVHSEDGRNWHSPNPPILGTGFLRGGGARQISDLWHWNDEGHIELSELDESTIIPGLFLVGPQVRQGHGIYCFIYKFRQRFAHIAQHICERLELETPVPESSQDNNWGPFGNSECCEGCEC